MAKITLRDYLEGIDELVEGGKIDEAIAHCRHVLKNFPKNVATYRLLGKAHLEKKRYGDAGDIFQRVLSSIPDDFVSHVGMSIIREDEGNTNAAISHMERAFEAQPSNRAVQDELRRLYGQREGFTPPKVRLTRAALARMYSHGDLYNQAISELRSAIREDGPRPELLVLLAEMYAKTDQNTQALQTSAEILEKLPYCLYANHLSAEMLTKENRSLEANQQLKKVEELDPYQIHVAAGEDARSVGAEEVVLEHLILHTSELELQEAPRAWTGALEPLIEHGEDSFSEELPDWLSVPPDEEDEETIEAPMSTSELKALQELAPDAPQESEQDMPTWMQELRPEEEQSIAEDEASVNISPFATKELAQNDEADESVEKDKPEEPASEKEELLDSDADDDGLAWLEGLAANQGAQEDELLTEPESRAGSEPEWLAPEDPETPEGAKRSLTWWLDELENSENIEATDITKDFDNPAASEEKEQDNPPSDDEAQVQFDEAPGGLAALNEEVDSPAEHEDTGQEDSTPDWLKELADEAGEETQSSERTSVEALEDAPDWLDELRTESNDLPDKDDLEGESEAEAQTSENRSALEGEAANHRDPLTDWLNDAEDDTESETEEFEAVGIEDLGKSSNIDSQAVSNWIPEKQMNEDSETSEESANAVTAQDSAEGGEERLLQDETLSRDARPPREASKADENQAKRLEQARQALNFDKFDDAINHYGAILRSRKFVDEVIVDLQAALMRHPRHVALWQTLGDAYMRADRLREALNSYTKAEELL